MGGSEPVTWPVAMYETERGEGLSVCVAHRGAHIWYLDGCQMLPLRRRRTYYDVPARRCPETGCSLPAETVHTHAPPLRVELDVDGLAAAIVRASRAAREERAPRPEQEQPAPALVAPTRPGERPLGGIPSLGD